MVDHPENRRFEILLDVLCCVMAADGKASASEKQQVADLMAEAGCQWTHEETAKRISRFVSRIRTMGFRDVLHWTCDDARLLCTTDQGKFITGYISVAEATPEIRPSVSKVIDQISNSLLTDAIGNPSGLVREQVAQSNQSQQGDLRPARLTPIHKWIRTGILFLFCVAGTVPGILRFIRSPRVDDDLMSFFAFGASGVLAGVVIAFILIMLVEQLLGMIIPAISDFRNAGSNQEKRRSIQQIGRAVLFWSLPWLFAAVALCVAQREQHPLPETIVLGVLPCVAIGFAISWKMTTETLEMTVLERFDLVRMVISDKDGNPVPISESYLITEHGIAWTSDGRLMDKNQRYRVRGRWAWNSAVMKFVVTSARPIESIKIVDDVPAGPILMVSDAKAKQSLTRTKLVLLGLALATTLLVATFCIAQGRRSEVAWLFFWYFPCLAMLAFPLGPVSVSRQLLSE